MALSLLRCMSMTLASRAQSVPTSGNAGAADTNVPPEIQREIVQAVAGIDFGSVEVIIHNGRVVQIEARRKRRFDEAKLTR